MPSEEEQTPPAWSAALWRQLELCLDSKMAQQSVAYRSGDDLAIQEQVLIEFHARTGQVWPRYPKGFLLFIAFFS